MKTTSLTFSLLSVACIATAVLLLTANMPLAAVAAGLAACGLAVIAVRRLRDAKGGENK